ncbi:hypothetical protein MELA_02632 [Candidatus Methylomirabilis lanthanidiphila]|uniref:Uncharacterized protein n=1 Tax=Candidatus Methylomirabilis lanthanidiphila TaxID=2211376 RepID=A0A564ZNK1_9BACT|nr:hypothetical protein MELA_02632 [Candidatus Methylomirabilis lanthanidiphila]
MFALTVGGEAGQTEEDDASMNAVHSKNQFAEVLVRREKQSAAPISPAQKRVIRSCWS